MELISVHVKGTSVSSLSYYIYFQQKCAICLEYIFNFHVVSKHMVLFSVVKVVAYDDIKPLQKNLWNSYFYVIYIVKDVITCILMRDDC